MAKGKRASIRAWQRVVRDNRELAPTNKLVLYTLATRTSADGMCCPTVKQLTEDCGLSIRSIRNYLRRGQELGFIAIERRFGDEGNQQTNLYRLTYPTEVLPPA